MSGYFGSIKIQTHSHITVSELDHLYYKTIAKGSIYHLIYVLRVLYELYEEHEFLFVIVRVIVV